MKTIYFITPLLFLVLSCCKDDDSDKQQITFSTHEEVVANNEYYFTCKIDGEFWHTRPPIKEDNEAFDWETAMEFDNKPTHTGNGDYGLLNIIAYRYADKENENEVFFDNPQRFDIFFANNDFCEVIDIIPETQINQTTNCASFLNHYNIEGATDNTDYLLVTNFSFWLDSAQSHKWNSGTLVPDTTGSVDVIWGRFEGKFTNENGDMLYVTEGKFKLLEGTWSQIYGSI